MFWRWLRGAGARPGEVADVRARISDALWADVLRRQPFLHLPDAADAERLRTRAAWLLASKTLHGAGGLVLTDAIRLAIAAQAALPILNLPVSLYEGWNEVIVYAETFRIARQVEDDAGVVHDTVEDLAGEAWPGGPVVLVWDADDSQNDYSHPGNVIIHEFAHKLDLHADGEANGMPALHRDVGVTPARWGQILHKSFNAFVDALEHVEASLPAHLDPDSHAADRWYAQLPLDPYAATDEAEFFAVSSEAFFTQPEPLARALPDWYALLAAYYRQDTMGRLRAC